MNFFTFLGNVENVDGRARRRALRIDVKTRK